MAQKRKLESLHGEIESGVRGLFRSSSIEDRESTFVAAFSPTLSSKELQGHPEFKTASHRIVAWRKRSGQQTLGTAASQIYNTGYDDDGEKYAGKRLERVLNELHVEGSVICARWSVLGVDGGASLSTEGTDFISGTVEYSWGQ